MSRKEKSLLALLMFALCAISVEMVVEKFMLKNELLSPTADFKYIVGKSTTELFYRATVFPDMIKFEFSDSKYLIYLIYEEENINGTDFPRRIILTRSGKVVESIP